MDITFYGANCVKLTTKKSSVVIDDNLGKVGKKNITSNKDISVSTNVELGCDGDGYFNINKPGEYEVNGVSIVGIATNLHYDQEKPGIIYSLHMGGFSIAILGHTVSDLKDSVLEKLGIVDILIIPVGGGGYTLDSVEATKLVKQIEPKVVIPTHYESKDINYEVPQSTLDDFVKSIGGSDVNTVDALKVKESTLPEKTTLVVINEK